jgi:hypothetical protein
MLVLIALQKLAASSIAAIRNALRKRRAMLADAVGRPDAIPAVLPDDEQTLDDAAEAEEALPGSAGVLLMKDEIRRLDELLALSETIASETKIERLLEMIRKELPADEPVLLFTEYKATQALVINALHRQLGFGTATFINGDERLDGLEQAGGAPRTVSRLREQAADAFNAGKVRFLVSTEAGGEGIDLQERCALLVHVDMPWNPMRLHQRVGRLYRYGQKRPVTAYILRNPDTVEARIWDLLTEKLERVQMALSSVMEEREDISQLVVGMAGSSFFNELFAGAQGVAGERLGAWFDRASATLGGRDVVETVRELLGNVARFDFQQVGKDLPKVDLPDLERFFTHAASRHGRRIFRRDNGLEIKTPDAWRKRSYALRDKYEGLARLRPQPARHELGLPRPGDRPSPLRHRSGGRVRYFSEGGVRGWSRVSAANRKRRGRGHRNRRACPSIDLWCHGRERQRQGAARLGALAGAQCLIGARLFERKLRA